MEVTVVLEVGVEEAVVPEDAVLFGVDAAVVVEVVCPELAEGVVSVVVVEDAGLSGSGAGSVTGVIASVVNTSSGDTASFPDSSCTTTR